MGQLCEVDGLLLLGGLSVLGLLAQGLRIVQQEDALAEAWAALGHLRDAELELQQACRDLRSMLRAERARCERLEIQLRLLRQWSVE